MVAAAGRKERDKGRNVEKLRPSSKNCKGGRRGQDEKVETKRATTTTTGEG